MLSENKFIIKWIRQALDKMINLIERWYLMEHIALAEAASWLVMVVLFN